MTKGNKGQAIIETVAVAGLITVIGLLVSRQVALKYILGIVWSLSLLHQIRRYDLINGLLVIIFSSAVVITLQGNLEYLLFLAQFIPVVLLATLIIRRGFTLGKGILCVFITSIIINSSLILTTLNKTNANIDALQSKLQFYVHSYMKVFDIKIIKQIVQLLPGVLTLNYVVAALTIYIIAYWFYKGKKASIPAFSTWYAPWYFIWLSILSFGMVALGNYVDSHFLIVAGCNLTLVIFPFLLVMGISVTVYYLKKWHPTTFTKVVIFFLALLSPQIVILLIMLIGIFDPYFDFRRLNSTSENQLGG